MSMILRVAAEILAKEFPTNDALRRYLKDHPKADSGKHSVRPKKDPSKAQTKREDSRAEAEAKDKGKPKTKAPSDNSDLPKDIQDKLKSLTPAKRKEVFQKALVNHKVDDGKPTKQKDVSKDDGFEVLKGLSPAAQKRILDRALKENSK